MYWSAINNAFFFTTREYECNGWDISDAIDVDDSIFQEFTRIYSNKVREVGSDGMPVWAETPPYVDPDPVSSAEKQKFNLLSLARNKISLWQTKLLLGRITDAEKIQLNLWLDYIDAVNAIDTSTAPNIKWPTPPAE